MLFNSLAFIIFFPIVAIVYWLLPVKWRNPFLLVASYYFYMNWEPRFALLILFSSVTTWGCALLMQKYARRRKIILTACLTVNFGILFVFKYLGFIASLITDALAALHIAITVPHFELLLPVGISFFTFQAVGYTIDVYRQTIKPERNILTYMLFVAFFPQLVAGPIERAKNLLPQFNDRHRFDGDEVIRGVRMMVIGYFMKLCIADSVSPYVDAVYGNIAMHNGTSIILATLFFTFQIFCDFGGYSLIAIGAARCMGFRLMQNFRQPYLATSVKDFWRRWHISLSSWFSDYLYIPMGGNRCSRIRHCFNLFVTFLVSGLWHGANTTFVAWGAYHGGLQVAHTLWHKKDKRKNAPVRRPLLIRLINIFVTFVLMMIGWVFFRANTMSDALLALKKMATSRGMLYNGEGKPAILLPLLLIGLLMSVEIYNEVQTDRGKKMTYESTGLRSCLLTAALIIVILLCAQFDGGQFIYFQF